MSKRLQNKVVLITGSSGGLGKLMAQRFLSEGCKIILTGSNPNKLDDTYHELGADAENMLAIPADIRTEEHVQVLVKQALDKGVRGAFLATKYSVKIMKAQKSGQIINICSVGSKIGLENLSVYCASKAALALFGDSLKVELKPYHIRVTNIFPHAINSGKSKIDPDSEKRRQMIEPEDVIEAVIAVTSSEEYVQYQDVTIYPASTTITKSEE